MILLQQQMQLTLQHVYVLVTHSKQSTATSIMLKLCFTQDLLNVKAQNILPVNLRYDTTVS